jgi:hypothetical protein
MIDDDDDDDADDDDDDPQKKIKKRGGNSLLKSQQRAKRRVMEMCVLWPKYSPSHNIPFALKIKEESKLLKKLSAPKASTNACLTPLVLKKSMNLCTYTHVYIRCKTKHACTHTYMHACMHVYGWIYIVHH